jgi:hypothetical protein
MDSLGRREFLTGSAALGAALASGVLGAAEFSRAAVAQDAGASPMPGPFRGKVAQVAHPGSIVDGAINREAVKEMMRRGMAGLTGEKDWASAWRRFFTKGDVVGVKVNPVGSPLAHSHHEVILEIIDGLRQAGLPSQDIVVFDRYRRQFQRAGYPGILPEGVRWDGAAEDYDNVQLDIEGYDPDFYLELPLISARFHKPDDPRARRSHVMLVVSRKVNKIINVPVLKDHGTGGVTIALKNMSHGFVNNVARSHDMTVGNACGQFIPAVVSMPAIRSKVVLHIMDGLRGVFQGGPSAQPRYTWEEKILSFATDPVAMDRIGWEIIDAKRKEMGLPALADTRVGDSTTYRQPEHILFAAALGLGESRLDRIVRERIALG